MAEWYYGKNNQQHGPVDTATLKQMARSGELSPSDLIWRDGMAAWAPAAQAKGLFADPGVASAASAPPAPAPAAPTASDSGSYDLAEEQAPDLAAWTTAPPAAAIPLNYSRPQVGAAPAYVGFWSRAAAAIIDWLVLMVIMMVVGLLLGVVLGLTGNVGSLNSPAVDGLFRLVALLIGWQYFALMESSSKQATLGKLAIGARVTDENGDRVSFGRATGRYFSKLLSSIFMIGYIMVAFSARKQGLHDLIAKTFVTRRPAFIPQPA